MSCHTVNPLATSNNNLFYLSLQGLNRQQSNFKLNVQIGLNIPLKPSAGDSRLQQITHYKLGPRKHSLRQTKYNSIYVNYPKPS